MTRTHSMTSSSLVLFAALAAGCGARGSSVTDEPLARPVAVRIENHRQQPLYLGGNRHLLSVRTEDGELLKAGPSHSEVDCDACDQRCGMVMDPYPVYVELPPLPKTLAEQRLFYRLVPDGCPCPDFRPMDCYQKTSLPPGTHTFEVPYTDQINAWGELTRATYNNELDQLEVQGQMGEAVLTSSKQAQVQFDGGEVVLVID